MYRTIVADPPWTPTLGATWKTRFTDKARPQKHYPTMTVDEICSLSVPSETQSHLYLWVIDPHVDWGYQVARAWGFEVWNMLTWCKPGLGTGRFQRNTEHVLMCRKGQRHGNPFGRTGGTRFDWPRSRHSQKPEGFYQLVERCSPAPYLELFSREKRLGWHAWGNEILSDLLIPTSEVIIKDGNPTQSSEVARAAQEIVDIAYRDKMQVPHRDTIAAIITKHLWLDD